MNFFRRKSRPVKDYSALLGSFDRKRSAAAPAYSAPLDTQASAPIPSTDTADVVPTKIEPKNDLLHKRELETLDAQLNALVNGEMIQELDGQRALNARLKSNLKDNRSKMRQTLRELKASRKRLESQKSELFDKCMTIDRQNAELRTLREQSPAPATVSAPKPAHVSVPVSNPASRPEPDLVARTLIDSTARKLREKLAQTQNTLDVILTENKTLKAEVTRLRQRDAERDAEMKTLQSEFEVNTERQSQLLSQITSLQTRAAAPAGNGRLTGTNNAAEVKQLEKNLAEAKERESILEKRLTTLKRDLDIVGQINTMLRGKIRDMENQASESGNMPERRFAGF